MYKNVINIRKEVPIEILKNLETIATEAFNNRAGRVKNTSTLPYRFIFEGGENDYGCLNLGILTLRERKDFVSYISSWNWIDEDDPVENCDVTEELSIPVR